MGGDFWVRDVRRLRSTRGIKTATTERRVKRAMEREWKDKGLKTVLKEDGIQEQDTVVTPRLGVRLPLLDQLQLSF